MSTSSPPAASRNCPRWARTKSRASWCAAPPRRWPKFPPPLRMAEPVAVKLRRLPHGEGLPLPAYATGGAAGMDVLAAEDVTLAPGARHAVATGLALAIPPGYEIQVRPRSGLALKHGISVPNTPGTIDSDYRGELKVILINHGREAYAVRRGDRIAQLVLSPVLRASWLKVDELDETQRGEGGFGSTGTAAISPIV